MTRPVGEASTENLNRYLSSIRADREDHQNRDNLEKDDHSLIGMY